MTDLPTVKKQLLEILNKEIEERENVLPTLVGWLHTDITNSELDKLRLIKNYVEVNPLGF